MTDKTATQRRPRRTHVEDEERVHKEEAEDEDEAEHEEVAPPEEDEQDQTASRRAVLKMYRKVSAVRLKARSRTQTSRWTEFPAKRKC